MSTFGRVDGVIDASSPFAEPMSTAITYTPSPTTGLSAHGPVLTAPRKQAPMQVQPPREDDLQVSYATVVAKDNTSKNWYGSLLNGLGHAMGSCGAIPCIPLPNPYKNVKQGYVGLITKFGKFHKAVDPGLVRVNPLTETLLQVDVKIQTLEVPTQTCITKDNVSITLTSVIYYHIVAPHKAMFGVANVKLALIERTQTTLRQVIGARLLQDVIERREEIATSIREIIEDVAAVWGVHVESMLIKDMLFSAGLQEALSMAAQSKRIGESKVIAARAEVESAKLMRQAADILSSAPAMQIRYLEAMQAMAKSANSKVIFLPAPNQTIPLSQLTGIPDEGLPGVNLRLASEDPAESDPTFNKAISAVNIDRI